MRNVILFALFIMSIHFISCKKCPKCPQCPETQGMSKAHQHYFKVYNGEIRNIQGSRSEGVFSTCEFTHRNFNYKRKYFNNSKEADILDTKKSYDFYYLTFSSTQRNGFQDTFLLLKNDSLDVLGLNTDSDDTQHLDKLISKGTLGCFPNFIIINNNLDYFETTSGSVTKRYIQLPFGYHEENQHVIQTLNNLDFEISLDNYTQLNNLLNTNPFFQGGIDIEAPDTLKLFYANGIDTGLRFSK
jgi:hypothetical protein